MPDDSMKILRANILAALRGNALLKTLHANWSLAETAGGHVFNGITDKLCGARNRGRAPFIEVHVAGEVSDEISTDAGIANPTVTIRGWYTNGSADSGVQPLQTMLKNCVLAIRNAYFDETQAYSESGVIEQQIYRRSQWDGPTLDRLRGLVSGDMVIEIEYTYEEDTLV